MNSCGVLYTAKGPYMPLYEYQCGQCGERSEILQKLSEAPATVCPKCGGELKKLHSAPAIQFKGSGFYKTDYASASSKAPASSTTKGESSTTETKSETKSESTSSSPATTTATKTD
jgi:putative FmdB family regulatory protein